MKLNKGAAFGTSEIKEINRKEISAIQPPNIDIFFYSNKEKPERKRTNLNNNPKYQ